jgi:hypothetical protein
VPRAAKKLLEPDPNVLYRAWTEFHCDVDGRSMIIRAGLKLRGSDVVVRTNPQYFIADGASDEDVDARRREPFSDDHPVHWASASSIGGRPMIPRIEESGGERGRRVVEGEGMVTPIRELVITDPDGSEEVLTPRRTRLAPEAEIVRERPELFTLCCKDDRTDAPVAFRAALRAADREVSRQLVGEPIRRSGSSTPTAREPWRLGP